MAKPIAQNPKRLLLQKIYTKLVTLFARHMGDVARARVSPVAAARELANVTQQIDAFLTEQLGRTGLPVVGTDAPAPEGAHWLVVPLASQRNGLYARNPLSVSVAYIEKDGTCPLGAVFMPLEDMCAIAEAGLGVNVDGIGRLRCGARTDLTDTLALVPWKTADVVAMDLLRKLDAVEIHTRKTGNTVADVLDVAMGRADMAIATRLNKLEALLSNLIMAESGAFASDLAGKPLGPTSETLAVANPKLQPKLVALLK